MLYCLGIDVCKYYPLSVFCVLKMSLWNKILHFWSYVFLCVRCVLSTDPDARVA